jgi:hypothetical protein
MGAGKYARMMRRRGVTNPCTPFGNPPLTDIAGFWDGTDRCFMWTTTAKTINVDANLQEVQVWTDKTINAYDATSQDLTATRSPKYVTNAINAGRSIQFSLLDSTTSFVRYYVASSILQTGAVIAMVYHPITDPNLKTISYPFGNKWNGTFRDQGIILGGTAIGNKLGIRIRSGAGTLNALTTVTPAINTTYVHICYKSGGNLIQRINGVEVYNAATAIPLDVDGISIGRRSDQNFQTDMWCGDVLIYADTISAAQILDIENYLIAKYT